jgi:hypothetical protein
MRAAMVGGGAYMAGKHVQKGRQQEAEQDAGPEEAEYQQEAPAPAAAATPDVYEQLSKLGELRKQGVLTEAEFEVQKQKLLQGV